MRFLNRRVESLKCESPTWKKLFIEVADCDWIIERDGSFSFNHTTIRPSHNARTSEEQARSSWVNSSSSCPLALARKLLDLKPFLDSLSGAVQSKPRSSKQSLPHHYAKLPARARDGKHEYDTLQLRFKRRSAGVVECTCIAHQSASVARTAWTSRNPSAEGSSH